jgi:3-deoxy-D-manno-octulosonate 8-phosphate phosphatase (KDO 8-P phosphatase)
MNILAAFKPIRLFALDVDGVLTDGSLLLMDDGQQLRRMSIKDGYALQLAIKKGYRILILSGAQSEAVKLRLQKLGVQDIMMGVLHKSAELEQYMKEHSFSREQVLFMGDDMPDYKVMQTVGLPCCPADAVAEIRDISHYISPVNGGAGCVRDIIEKVLKLNGHWRDDETIAAR